MGNNTDTRQIQLPNFLNDINYANILSTYTSPTGNSNRFSGFLGAIITLDNDDAYKHSDSTVGTLYHGRYQLVQNSGTVAVRGQAAFWPTASLSALAGATRYQVTNTATDGQQAGTFINALAANDYGFIQLDGLCSVQWAATLTAATPALGDLVYVSTGAATYDDPELATVTDAALKRLVGVLEGTAPVKMPVQATLGTVEVFPRIKNW